MSIERKDEPTEIEISFGAVFEHTSGEQTKKFVIIDVGTEEYLFSSSTWEEDGKLIVSLFSGTTTFSDIHQMLDEKLCLEQIIEGMKNHYGDGVITEKMIQLITESSNQPPRILTK